MSFSDCFKNKKLGVQRVRQRGDKVDISVRDTKIESFYPELKRIGFNGVDVNFPAWDQREYILSEKFKDTVMENYKHISNVGLKVCQTHLTYYPGHYPPLGDGSYKAFEDYMLPIFMRELELVSKMNCNIAVIHLYFEESRENSRAGNIQLIGKLLPIAEKSNVILSIENIFGYLHADVHLSTAEDLLYYTDHFNSDHLGICLDTGHAVTRRQDPIEMAGKIGSALKALHVHSNVPERDLHLPPYLINRVDWQRFCDTLSEIGYRGAFNMEITAPKQMNILHARLRNEQHCAECGFLYRRVRFRS